MPIPTLHHEDKYDWKKREKKGFFSGYKGDRKKLIKIGLIVLAGCFLIGLTSVAYLSKDLPDPNKLINREVAQSTKIYDRKGETILYEIHGDEKRTLVSLNDIPLNVRNATIGIEDKNFYKHGGFSLWAIFRTVVKNVLTGSKAGGSTLTQQFVKNAILTNEKTYTRKIKELILAYQMEKKFTKDEILQMYLNEIPYGSTAYGVEAASLRYFGKSVKDTNLAEAAILAALPQAPSRYSPYGEHTDLLFARQHYILDQMVDQGYITKDEAEAAKQYKIQFSKQNENILAPHFVMYIKDYLSEKYDQKTIEQGGLKIITTLDLDKQKIAEEVVKDKTLKNAKKYKATNAALVSIDPKTGQVLAMVGSRDYFDKDIDGQVNIALSNRQPGSSFKPIVYATAFGKGYTPNTILYDVTTNFSTDPDKKYEPHNYNGKENGPVTMRKALAGSLNIPAVETMYLAGIDNVMDQAKQLGYTTLNDKDRFGLSLVLGGGEVKLLEHTNAYSAFARDGVKSQINPILKIEDASGKTLEEYKDENKKVLDGQVARQVTSILSDNAARSYVFGARNFLTLSDRAVAAKTGTTNDYKDAWAVGYTPSVVTGVWVGNNNATSMSRGADGSVVAAPIWHEYMRRILTGTPVEEFKKPDSYVTGKGILDGVATSSDLVKIDKTTGLLATEYTPASYIEEKNFSQPHSILYYVDKDDPRGPAPKDPSRDPQFNSWEAAVKAWAIKNNLFATTTPPTEKDNVHVPENKPTITIDSPIDGQSIVDPLLTANVTVSAPRGVFSVKYLIDGKLFYDAGTSPFSLSKNASFIGNGEHTLTASVCDDVDNCTDQSIKLNFNLPQSNATEALNVNISDPITGTSIKAGDFPLALKTYASNPDAVNGVTYYLKPKNGSYQPITNIKAIDGNLNVWWLKAPTVGAYSLYAEVKDWNDKKYQTTPIDIAIIK